MNNIKYKTDNAILARLLEEQELEEVKQEVGLVSGEDGYETHAGKFFTTDDVITLRDKATVGLGSTKFTGLVAKNYDGLNDGQLVFDADGYARVGDKDSLQMIATRENTPMPNGIAFYDETSRSFKTKAESSLSVAQALNANKLGGISASNYYHSGNSNKNDVDWTANNLWLNGGRLRTTKLTTGNNQVINPEGGSIYFGNPSTLMALESNSNPRLNIGGSLGVMYSSHNANKSDVDWAAKNIIASGSGSFVGNISTTGIVVSDTYFTSSDSAVVLAPNGAGTVYLRPNGKDTGLGALSVNSSGYLTVAGGGSFSGDVLISSTSPNLKLQRTDSVAAFDAITFLGTGGNLDYDAQIGFHINQLRLTGKSTINSIIGSSEIFKVDASGTKTTGDSVATGKLLVSGDSYYGINGNNKFGWNGSADIYFKYNGRGTGGRAFVHAPNNALVINYGGDFSGGVQIGSGISILGKSYISGNADFGGNINLLATTGEQGNYISFYRGTPSYSDGADFRLKHDYGTFRFQISTSDSSWKNVISYGNETASIDGSFAVRDYIGSPTYASGFSGSGWRIDHDGTANFDNAYIRKTLNVYELLIQKIRSVNGSIVVSSANGKVAATSLEHSGATMRVVLEEAGGFVVGDRYRCQTFRASQGVKYYVSGNIGWISTDGKILDVYNYAGSWDGTDFPEVGDEIVQWGSTVSDRQGMLYMTASDSGAPYLDVLDGVNGANMDNKTKVRLGKLNGITDAELGGALTGYGLYSENVFLKGKIVAKSGLVGDWNIETGSIYGISKYGNNGYGLTLLHSNDYYGVVAHKNNAELVELFNRSNGWGLRGADATGEVFLLGSKNQIAGWTFTNNALYTSTGAYGDGVTIGLFKSSSGTDSALYPSQGLQGLKLTYYKSFTGGEDRAGVRAVVGALSDSYFYKNEENGKYGFELVGGRKVSNWGDIVFRASIEKSTGNLDCRIAGWTFDNSKLYKGLVYGSGAGIELYTHSNGGRLMAYTNTTNYTELFQSGSSYGVQSYKDGSPIFQLGSTNQIAGWKFDDYRITSNVSNPDSWSGETLIKLSTKSSGSSYIYNGSQTLQGFSMMWHRSSNAGHIVMGQVASNGSTIKQDFKGIQMMDYLGYEYFCLSANVNKTGGREVYNRIAGWSFDESTIWAQNIQLNASGCIRELYDKWRLNSDGSGVLANGAINWNASGVLNVNRVTAIDGTIGGWSIDGAYIWSGTKQTSDTYSSAGMTLASSGAIRTPEFYISNIDGSAHFKGTLDTPKGTIGGFVISEDSIVGNGARNMYYSSGSGTTPGSQKSVETRIDINKNEANIRLTHSLTTGILSGVTEIGSDGILCNSAGMRCVSSSTGLDYRGAIVGLGYGSMSSRSYIGNEYNMMCGVFGIGHNTSSSPCPTYGGYFTGGGVFASRLVVGTKDVYIDYDGETIDVSNVTYLSIFPESLSSANNQFYLANAVHGQVLYIFNRYDSMSIYVKSGVLADSVDYEIPGGVAVTMIYDTNTKYGGTISGGHWVVVGRYDQNW
ncbi:hypothetical protein EO244_16645 [Ancylomarina salipaludis]|uniref:Uncharacterized protein n=1 Tax=Ancylomarina salipaludis TaxID=2501299 RepID=A0A4Q1JIH0_9BACT|nr:hypothetical protein [Ancylomarina salipaludis]RXQ87188.1 hypothetical protein EO244_16645 [Ancylomarina salipaludis]